MAGSGGDQDKVARRSAELEIADAVHFLGYRTDLPAALSAADAGLFASQSSEGTSRVVLEWMALGKPVAATDVGCVRELLTDGREGLIVPPEDPAALASAMERLATSADLRRQMGVAARDRAQSEFNRGVWTRKMVALYREALSGTGEHRGVRTAESSEPPGRDPSKLTAHALRGENS
jgi:glycosyltransferase involved in cell wall biosynthesis